MKAAIAYWGYNLKDRLRHNPLLARLLASIFLLAGRVSRSALHRLGHFVRAARLYPQGSWVRRLNKDLGTEVGSLLVPPVDWRSLGLSSVKANEIPKGLILKPPISSREKGILYITFQDNWLRLIHSPHLHAIGSRYDLILGPSFSPPPDAELLFTIKLWPGRLYSFLSNFQDATLLRALDPRIVPIPLLASSWVDPDAFLPHLTEQKDYDIVMLSNFATIKRHWLFFQALGKMPLSVRVLLMGVPLGSRTEEVFLAEASRFGVKNRFDLIVRPRRDQLMDGLARAKISLIFSQREGGCISVPESLFANTPVGLFADARIGSRDFINWRTGRLLHRENLPQQLMDFLSTSTEYQPRDWALQHVSCQVSLNSLNQTMQVHAKRLNNDWTRNVVPFAKDLVPRYLTREIEMEMQPWYEDFAASYGLLIGPAARLSGFRTSTPHHRVA